VRKKDSRKNREKDTIAGDTSHILGVKKRHDGYMG